MTDQDRNQREHDMVRYMRAELHEAGLITQQEYGELISEGSGSARRLEDYDALRAKLAASERKVAELTYALSDEREGVGEAHREADTLRADRDRLAARVKEIEHCPHGESVNCGDLRPDEDNACWACYSLAKQQRDAALELVKELERAVRRSGQ